MSATMKERDLREIRDAVAKLCAGFPGEYSREPDRERRYPTEFVRALPGAGVLLGYGHDLYRIIAVQPILPTRS